MKPIFLSLILVACSILRTSAQEWSALYKNYLPNNEIAKIVIDKQGNKWFATWNYGVSKYDNSKWVLDENSANFRFRDLMILDDGSFWSCAEYGGASYVKNGKGTHHLGTATVSGVAKDSKGNFWFATTSGLAKFDGAIFTYYNLQNSGVIDDYIISIVVDNNDKIWAGSYMGLSCFDGTTWKTYTTTNGLISNRINRLLKDSNGTIWVGSDAGGVAYFSDNKFIPIPLIKKAGAGYYTDVTFNGVTAMSIDNSGAIWAGFKDKCNFTSTCILLGKYSNGTWTTYSVGNYQVTAIAPDTDGSVWIATTQNGVTKLRDGVVEKRIIAPIEIRTIAIDKDNTPWTGSDKGGITSWGIDGCAQYTTQNANIALDYVNDITFDSKGNLWAAFWENGGISKFDKTKWETWSPTKGFKPMGADGYMWSIYTDKNDKKWIGTGYSGLMQFNDTTFTTDTIVKNPNLSDAIFDLAQDIDGSFWLATRQGLAHWKDSVLKIYTTTNSLLKSDWIYCVNIDKQGVKFIGTANGLVKIENGNWTVYTPDNSTIPDYMIDDIAFDSKGNVWMGSSHAGMIFFDRKTTFISYHSANSPTPGTNVTSVAVDAYDNIYAGYYGYGIMKFKPSNVAVKQNFVQNEIVIYPSPARDFITVETSNCLTLNKIQVVDLQGAVCMQYFPNQSISTIDIAKLPKGIYLMVATCANGKSLTSRFIKE